MATRADDDEADADPQVEPLVANEARRDALVDDVALLEEQLPGRDRGADDADDQQHHVAQLAARRQLRNDEVARHLRERRMDHEIDRHEQEARADEDHREALEAPEVAGADGDHDQRRGDDDARGLVEAEVIERQRDADELGDDGQGVEQEQVDDAERAPELAEALEDQPRVADAGHGAQAQHHLLIDVENGNQQRQRPQQRGAVGLAGLAVGREGAGVVVADHDDEAGSEDGEKRRQPMLPGRARSDVAVKDGAEGASDVADVRVVEDGGHRLRDVGFHGHGLAPLPPPRRGESLGPSAGWACPASHRRRNDGFAVRDFEIGTRRGVADVADRSTRAVVQSGLLLLTRPSAAEVRASKAASSRPFRRLRHKLRGSRRPCPERRERLGP